QSDGKSSRLILDVPVGGYAPAFRRLDAAPPEVRASSFRAPWLILAGTAITCAALLFAAEHERRLILRSTASAATAVNPLSPSVAGIWRRFLDSDAATLLVVSNPDVGECADRKPGTAGCTDEYTGMGEAV